VGNIKRGIYCLFFHLSVEKWTKFSCIVRQVNQGGTFVDGKFTAVDSDLNTTMLV